MTALESVPLILCVDQLEDIYNLDDAATRFRRAMATLCDLVSRIPTAVVVISCLEDFYDLLKGMLPKPVVDRIERDPTPILLKATREDSEVVPLIAHRLRYALRRLRDVALRDDEPTFPFPRGFPETTRRHEDPRRARTLPGIPRALRRRRPARRRSRTEIESPQPRPPPHGASTRPRSNRPGTTSAPPSPATSRPRTRSLAALLAGAIRDCSKEVETGHWFEAEAEGRLIEVERHGPDNAVSRILVGVCNANAQGGRLGKQVAEVVDRAGKDTPVLVRSTAFPGNVKTAIATQLGQVVARGGRRVVVEDSDWRTMLALRPIPRPASGRPGPRRLAQGEQPARAT